MFILFLLSQLILYNPIGINAKFAPKEYNVVKRFNDIFVELKVNLGLVIVALGFDVDLITWGLKLVFTYLTCVSGLVS